MKEVKNMLITHTDLDGVGCGVVFKYYHSCVNDMYVDNSNDDVEIICLGHNDEIQNLITDGEFDEIRINNLFIADIVPDKETLKYLMSISDNVRIVDHHKTNKWVETDPEFFEWFESSGSIIEEEVKYNMTSEKTSATYLLWHKIFRQSIVSNPEHVYNWKTMDNFVKHVTNWDTFEYKSNNDITAKLISSYMYSFNKIDFNINDIIDAITSNIYFSNTILEYDQYIKAVNHIAREEEQITAYLRMIETIKLDNITYGVQYTDRSFNISEVAYRACNNSEFDIYLCVYSNHNSVSMRKSDKFDIDLSEIASSFDGGGHPNAAGFKLPEGFNYDDTDGILKSVHNIVTGIINIDVFQED